MYKRYAGWISISHIILLFMFLMICFIRQHHMVNAFHVMNMKDDYVQERSFLGVAKEQISAERVVKQEIITRKDKMELNEEDYECLLRIVEAEAGGEDIMGKMLVANVVINRVLDDRFPDTVKEVVFQESNGIAQFSPIADGRYYRVKISEETVNAVNRVLMGEDNSEGALFFAARAFANKEFMDWFDTHLTPLFTHGGHEFFS